MEAANIKIFHERPEHPRHDFKDEFAHLAWDADLGLEGISMVAVPLFTLTDRQAVGCPRGAWEWQYKGRRRSGCRKRRSGTASPRYNSTSSTPSGKPTKARTAAPGQSRRRRKRDTELRARAIRNFPGGTQVGRPCEGTDSVSRIAVRRVCDFQAPYWRVRYPDGDWEELSRRKINDGVLRCQGAY